MLREMREFDQALIVKKLTGLGFQLKSMRLKNSVSLLWSTSEVLFQLTCLSSSKKVN